MSSISTTPSEAAPHDRDWRRLVAVVAAVAWLLFYLVFTLLPLPIRFGEVEVFASVDELKAVHLTFAVCFAVLTLMPSHQLSPRRDAVLGLLAIAGGGVLLFGDIRLAFWPAWGVPAVAALFGGLVGLAFRVFGWRWLAGFATACLALALIFHLGSKGPPAPALPAAVERLLMLWYYDFNHSLQRLAFLGLPFLLIGASLDLAGWGRGLTAFAGRIAARLPGGETITPPVWFGQRLFTAAFFLAAIGIFRTILSGEPAEHIVDGFRWLALAVLVQLLCWFVAFGLRRFEAGGSFAGLRRRLRTVAGFCFALALVLVAKVLAIDLPLCLFLWRYRPPFDPNAGAPEPIAQVYLAVVLLVAALALALWRKRPGRGFGSDVLLPVLPLGLLYILLVAPGVTVGKAALLAVVAVVAVLWLREGVMTLFGSHRLKGFWARWWHNLAEPLCLDTARAMAFVVLVASLAAFGRAWMAVTARFF